MNVKLVHEKGQRLLAIFLSELLQVVNKVLLVNCLVVDVKLLEPLLGTYSDYHRPITLIDLFLVYS